MNILILMVVILIYYTRRLLCHDCVELMKEVKNIREKMTEDNANMEKQVDELSEKLTEDNAKLQKQVDELSEKISRMCEMQTEVIKNVNEMMGEIKHSQQTMPSPLFTRRSIIVAGGQNKFRQLTNSVEIFNWVNKTWTLQNAMSTCRSTASAVIYKGQVIISGGTDGSKSTDTMDTSSCDEPLQWNISHHKIPNPCEKHAAVIYKDSLLLSGGRIASLGKAESKIYAISMVPPYSTKILTSMSESRYDHTMELFEDKLFIFGGYKGGAKDSVMMYDLITKEWKMMPPLPYVIDEMASVLWRNNVILLGGRNGLHDGFSTILMYNLASGESKYLPSMKHKRRGCTAVVTGDVLVVMGGFNEESKYLKSVEAFSFEHEVWEELPDMNEARQYASAVVKPN